MYEMITHPIHSPPHGSDPGADDNNLTGHLYPFQGNAIR